MKILVMSESGDGFGVAHKLAQEGHDVRVYVKERKFEYAMLGIVKFVDSWRPVAADWAELVIADMVGFGNFATVLDKFNVPHLGFSLVGDVLELDRQKQMSAFRKVGIRIPETYEFDSPGEAKEMIRGLWTQETRGWALKPSGNIATGKTFIVRERETLDWALDQYTGDQELIAQKLVEGVEISTEGWFNGSDWVEPFNHTMEEKRFLNGDLGPNTGCMGNVVWTVSDEDAFVRELKRLTPVLRNANYKGPVDLNMIANQRGLFALELTTRFGYDAMEAFYELLEEPLAGVLLDIAMGGRKQIKITDRAFGVAVRITVPPYPHAEPSEADRGLPVFGVPSSPNDQRPYHLTDVYKDDNLFRWAAADGVLMKVTAKHKNLDKARQMVYDRVSRIRVQGAQYRTDIGERVERDIAQLREWGHLPAAGGFLAKLTG